MAVTPSTELPAAVRRLLEERLSRGDLDLPVLPDAAQEVLALCDEPADARLLAETLQRDQALAAHVLRVANSAAYAPKEPIVSLREAVSRLGTGAVRELVLTVLLRGRVFHVPGHGVRIRAMWMHTAAAAVYAREIARLVGHDHDGAFLCGLLHDVGKPIVMQALIDLASDRTQRQVPGTLLDAASAEFHERLGARLVEQWELPAWMAAAVGHHHDYGEADEFLREARITHLADRLSHWALDDTRSEEDFESEAPVIPELGLDGGQLVRLFGMRGRVLEVAESFL